MFWGINYCFALFASSITYFWFFPINYAPKSNLVPSISVVKVFPPKRSNASIIVISNEELCVSRWSAAHNPDKPPPIIKIFIFY